MYIIPAEPLLFNFNSLSWISLACSICFLICFGFWYHGSYLSLGGLFGGLSGGLPGGLSYCWIAKRAGFIFDAKEDTPSGKAILDSSASLTLL